MHRCFTRYAPLAALTIIMVLMAGCSGGYGPTLPSPDGGGDPMAVMIGP